MNRKDFELIARTIKKLPERQLASGNCRAFMVGLFLDGLKDTGLDRAKFQKACGVG